MILLRYESFILRTVLHQRQRTDLAAEIAADAATETFAACIYEEDPLTTAKTVFEYTYSTIVEEEGIKLLDISASCNGIRIIDGAGFENAKEGDMLSICFELGPVEIKAPGRRLFYEKTIVRSLTLD